MDRTILVTGATGGIRSARLCEGCRPPLFWQREMLIDFNLLNNTSSKVLHKYGRHHRRKKNEAE